MLIRINRARRRINLVLAALLACGWVFSASIALAQASPAPAPSPAAPAVPITTADIKGVSGPSTADLAKGDPGGTLTGTVSDIPVSDTKAGLTLADVVNTAGKTGSQ